MQDFVNKSKYKMCISIVQKANENSIEFSLSTQTRRVIKSSQTKLLHYALVLPKGKKLDSWTHKCKFIGYEE